MALILDTAIVKGTSAHGLREAIIRSIFVANIHAAQSSYIPEDFHLYFKQCYEDHCKGCFRHISVTTHRELLKAVTFLMESRDPQSLIVENLYQHRSDPNLSRKKVEATVILGARVLTMLSIGEIENCVPPGQTIEWDSGSLLDAVAAQFPASKITDDEKIPKVFKAANFERIAGINVCWTSNLADHLLMGINEVRLFHHVSFLKHHEKSELVFPAGFIDETMRTLALLIPSNDPESGKWFKKQQGLEVDPRAATCGHLKGSNRHTGDFSYWKDRLIILKEAFDEAEPGTVKQWWYDDRKKVQMWTFWLAAVVLILTILFGLIQSITGAISAWAALKAIPS